MKNSAIAPIFSAVLGTVLTLFPAAVHGEVERKGEWPEDEPVSLSLDAAPRKDALRRLADVAGWSLVVEGPTDSPVTVEVRDQPAHKVMELLLSDGDYVVERDGTLISVRPRVNPTGSPPSKHVQRPSGDPAEDLFISDEGFVGKDQTVRDLFVMGSAVVEGTVTGSVVVFGGKAKFVRGSRVGQDVVAFGGAIELEDGVEVGGDVAALFGALRRGDGPDKKCATCVEGEPETGKKFLGDVFSHLTSAAVMWLVGAITIAMAGSRLALIRQEIERRPLRNVGIGIVVFLVTLLLIVTLVFTLVGIPLALLTVVGGIATTYVAFTALPLAVGRRLVGKRSTNPYVFLGAGCVALFLILCVPVAGPLACVFGAFMSLGALYSTRLAGFSRRALTGTSRHSAD